MLYIHVSLNRKPCRHTGKGTHPAAQCTNDTVGVCKMIVFEAGNCIKSAL